LYKLKYFFAKYSSSHFHLLLFTF